MDVRDLVRFGFWLRRDGAGPDLRLGTREREDGSVLASGLCGLERAVGGSGSSAVAERWGVWVG